MLLFAALAIQVSQFYTLTWEYLGPIATYKIRLDYYISRSSNDHEMDLSPTVLLNWFGNTYFYVSCEKVTRILSDLYKKEYKKKYKKT